MFNGKKYTYRQHGFTLVEATIALLVFMVIMLGLAKSELSVSPRVATCIVMKHSDWQKTS